MVDKEMVDDAKEPLDPIYSRHPAFLDDSNIHDQRPYEPAPSLKRSCFVLASRMWQKFLRSIAPNF